MSGTTFENGDILRNNQSIFSDIYLVKNNRIHEINLVPSGFSSSDTKKFTKLGKLSSDIIDMIKEGTAAGGNKKSHRRHKKSQRRHKKTQRR